MEETSLSQINYSNKLKNSNFVTLKNQEKKDRKTSLLLF